MANRRTLGRMLYDTAVFTVDGECYEVEGRFPTQRSAAHAVKAQYDERLKACDIARVEISGRMHYLSVNTLRRLAQVDEIAKSEIIEF